MVNDWNDAIENRLEMLKPVTDHIQNGNPEQYAYDMLKRISEILYDAVVSGISEFNDALNSTDDEIFIRLPSNMAWRVAYVVNGNWVVNDFRLPEREVQSFTVKLELAGVVVFASCVAVADVLNMSWIFNWIFNLNLDWLDHALGVPGYWYNPDTNTYTQNSTEVPYVLSDGVKDIAFFSVITLIIVVLKHLGLTKTCGEFTKRALTGATEMKKYVDMKILNDKVEGMKEEVEGHTVDLLDISSKSATILGNLSTILENIQDIEDEAILEAINSLKAKIGLRLAFQ